MSLRIATWNVNGLRARADQLVEWLTKEQPDVACLQEIKATTDQIPAHVAAVAGYKCYWHGLKGYSGVALLVREDRYGAPTFTHPAFDLESRIVVAACGSISGTGRPVEVASIYVPNGGKDLEAKMRFLEAMDAHAAEAQKAGREIVLCGDLNVARTDMDVHPKERKPVTGQSPPERALLARILSRGLVDLGRAHDPDNEGLFTWWAPWRNMRQKNVGWRLDYVLASESLAKKMKSCVVQKDVGTSDHAPVMADLDI